MRERTILEADWRDPAEVLAGFADEPYAMALLSGGGRPDSRWSYVMRTPSAVVQSWPDDPADPFAALRDLLGQQQEVREGPPFQGGLAGLCAYELGARVEALQLGRTKAWPDLACALYPAVLAFDHESRRVLAIGRGDTAAQAHARALAALGWIAEAGPAPGPGGAPAEAFEPVMSGGAYEAAVAAVVERIAAGEIFQANIARPWRGRLKPGAAPFDGLRRLMASSPAPFAAYLRLPGAALVSNSPERFLQVRDGGLTVETRPIKGTRPRSADPLEDARLQRALLASAKDRAENLMIVDLMRNDLARVCAAGQVKVSRLFELETFTNVHHLVSTVRGRLAPGLTALDLLESAFPPGSITGAPKVQAMKVIADYEPPRGPYCGSLFWAGFDGGLDSSVLIRTASFVEDAAGWEFEARAGAGIVADSDPHEERLETEAKIDAIRRAFVG